MTAGWPAARLGQDVELSLDQATALLEELRAANGLYPSVVDRYARVRAGVAPAALAAVDSQLAALDQDVFFASDEEERLSALVQSGGPMVPMDRESLERTQDWTAGVRAADDAVRRLEGAGPAQAAPAGVPWWAAVLGGAALFAVIAAFAAATE